MDENFKRKRGSELARRFEEGLKKQQFSFFDLEDYEEIISYFMGQNKPKKALQASKQAENPSLSRQSGRIADSPH